MSLEIFFDVALRTITLLTAVGGVVAAITLWIRKRNPRSADYVQVIQSSATAGMKAMGEQLNEALNRESALRSELKVVREREDEKDELIDRLRERVRRLEAEVRHLQTLLQMRGKR